MTSYDIAFDGVLNLPFKSSFALHLYLRLSCSAHGLGANVDDAAVGDVVGYCLT